MKQPQLQALHEQISQALNTGKISYALSLLQAMAQAASAPWELTSEIRRLSESFGYLRRYALDGVTDPSRQAMLKSISAKALQLSGNIIRLSLVNDSPKQYFGIVRYERMQHDSSIPLLLNRLIEAEEQLSLMSLTDKGPSNARVSALKAKVAELGKRIFNLIWTTHPLAADDAAAIEAFLKNETIRSEHRAPLLGALFLGTLEYYDEAKMILLAKTYLAGEKNLEINALVELVLAMWMQRDSLSGRTFGAVMATVSEHPGWHEDLKTAFLSLARTRDTDRINRTMNEEVIPEMLKLRPEIFKKLSDKDISAYDSDPMEGNPEWEELLEKSGVADKLKALNDMQNEGSDVMLSTFSGLKSFEFFREPANWFLPFHTDQTDVAKVLDDSALDLGELIDLNSLVCDNDKYSIVFSLERMPSASRRMMLEQFKLQNINIAELRNSLLNPENASRASKMNHFIHDLYRFFTLYRRKGEFTNPFATPVNLAAVPMLAPDLKDTMAVEAVGEFYFKRGYYAEAFDIFTMLLDSAGADNLPAIQKAGYSAQRLGKLEQALDYYNKSELMAPDGLWTARRKAQVLKQMGRHAEAIPYYERLAAAKPDDLNVALNLGHCYLATDNYQQALKCYFKVEYMDPEGQRALRPIAWCSFVEGDYDRATKYYTKILNDSPTPTDHLNAGHLQMALKNFREAARQYREFAKLNNGDSGKLYTALDNDLKYLTAAGVDPTMISLVADAAIYPEQQ
ncbi:MAG: tetratricopeptide repeat protein [Firmicutes bacterium]|nr:tetratricopeptide repeat protein [Bacillota bacterium]MCM1477231.1 tetratricopeptide repeat protein [Bacteroides sp.]